MLHLLYAALHSVEGSILSDWAKMAAALCSCHFGMNSILGGEEKEIDPVIQYHRNNYISRLALKVYTVATNAVSNIDEI